MTEKQKLLAAFRGKIISGTFTKQDGSPRPFWGVLKSEKDLPDNIVVTFDFRKKQYRRFDLNQPYALLNREMVGSTLLTDTVMPNPKEGDDYWFNTMANALRGPQYV